jgi:hypothetical protein
MSLADTFSMLGQQFQQAILNLYQPQAGGLSNLVFVPGGVPVSTDDLVQSDGSGNPVVNPAQLSTWLEAVVDSPLQINIADASLLGTTVTLESVSSIVKSIVQFAVPSSSGDSAADRVAQEISAAGANVGSGVLPLSTEPSDWALSTSTGWTQFESTQVTESEVQNSGTAHLPPKLWQLVLLPSVRANLATATPAAPSSTAASPNTQTLAPQQATSTHLLAQEERNGALILPEKTMPVYLPIAAQFADAPIMRPPSTTTQQSTSVTMSVEHTLAIVDRTPWWPETLIADPEWYIPGLPRGTYVGVPSDPANSPFALPVAIVLARNVSLQGTWTAADATSLITSGVSFGPFGLNSAQVTSSNEVTTVSIPGISLIALWCEPLPVLPPTDASTIAAASAPPTTPAPDTPTSPSGN